MTRRGGAGHVVRLAFLLAVTLCGFVPKPVAGQTSSETDLIAAFLYRFGQYVEWPSSGVASDAPLIIGIFGDDDVLEKLGAVASDRELGGRPVQVKELDSPDDVDGIWILYLNTEDRLEVGQGLRAASSKPVLTVGYTDGFAERGGVINLYRDGRRIRFEVNPDAADRAGLRISSQLLRLARIISAPSQGLER